MKKQPRKTSKTQPPRQLTLTLDPNAVLPVKLIESPKAETRPRRRLIVLTILLVFPIVSGLVWYKYVNPRITQSPQEIGAGNLAVALSHPAYINRDDGAEIDVTIVNRGVDPVSATLVIAFQSDSGIMPMAREKTGIRIEDLAGGAGITEQIRIDAFPGPTSSNPVLINLQGKVGNQTIPSRQISRIAVAPFRSLKTITREFFKLAIIGIVTAWIALLWEEFFKKRWLGVASK